MRWTLPNILTLARICLTPVIALLPFISGYWPKVIAFLVFLAAAISDAVDGYLARRYHQVSELGQLLDPIDRKSTRLNSSHGYISYAVFCLKKKKKKTKTLRDYKKK